MSEVRQLRTGADGDLLRWYKTVMPTVSRLVEEFTFYDKELEEVPNMTKYLEMNILEVQATIANFIESDGKALVKRDGGRRA